MRSRVFGAGWMTALAVVLGAGCAGGARESRAPGGPPVGRMARSYTDTARLAWDGHSPRPLATVVWYRAAAGSVETPWEAGVFRFGRGARDAAFADTVRHPLIVLSHGTGGSAAQLSWLAEALAEQGFIVAGVNHHGNTAVEPHYEPAGFVLPWERARDLSVLIDRLIADPVIGPHIDTTRIGAAGFSLGGYTVLALAGAKLPEFDAWDKRCAAQSTLPECTLPPEADFTNADVTRLYRTDSAFRAAAARGANPTRDSRVRAILAIAPALMTAVDPTSMAASTAPVRVILGGADTGVPAAPTAVALASLAPNAELTTLGGVIHYAWLAPCSLKGRLFERMLCADGGEARVRLHTSVGTDAAGWFRERLGVTR